MEGVHRGNLTIIVKEALKDDLIVQFISKPGWKPS